MANETAATYVPLGREGTGYATILQNNILPALQNEQRRADRLYQMEELAKQAAAKAAAKQAEEDQKYAPQFEAITGGYLAPIAKALNEKRIKQGLDVMRTNAPLNEKQSLVNEINRQAKEDQGIVNFVDKSTEEEVKNLSPYYNIGRRDIGQYFESVPVEEGSLYKTNHVNEFAQKVRRDPEKFKWREVGNNLFKTVGQDDVSYTDARGENVTIKRDKLFIPVQEIDPITNKTVPSKKLDGEVAMQVIQGDREVLNALTNYVDIEKRRLAAIPENSTATDEELEKTATKRGMDRLFAGMGGVSYKEDLQTEQGKQAARNRADKQAELEVGAPQDYGIYITSPDGKQQQEVVLRNVIPMNSKREVGLPAGIVVHPVGNYADPDGLTSRNVAGGSSAKVLRSNVAAQNFAKAEGVPIATRDVDIYENGQKVGFVKKDGVISYAINNPKILETIPGAFKFEDGYFASPIETQIEQAEDVNGDIIYKRKGPKATSLLGPVFIPNRYAGTINATFKDSLPKPKKRGNLRTSGY